MSRGPGLPRGVRIAAALCAVAWLGWNAWHLASRVGLADRLDHSIGVYVVLAELARQGVVYPAPQTPELVYCTFYQPLGFLPYAVLPGTGIDLVVAMRALVRVEVFACLALAAWLVRRAGASWARALLAAALALGALPVGAATLTTTDDPRGALFALLALAVGGDPAGSARVRRWSAAVCLTLAFLTKLTAPIAAGAALLFACGWWRAPAWRLLAACAVLTAVAYAVAHLLLGWDLAGNGLRYALFDTKPGRGLAEQFAEFCDDLGRDGVLASLLGGGLIVSVGCVLRRAPRWCDIWLLAALSRAVIEYHSHGTEVNHLFEAALAAAVVLGSRAPRATALLGVVSVCWGFAPVCVPVADPAPLRDSQVAIGARVLAAQPVVPTLTEAPLLGWLAGQRPVVTDPFLAGLVLARQPEIRAAWFGDGSHALQRLVLLADPERDARAEHWYRYLHFDAQFLADVRRDFRVLAPLEQGAILVRR